MTRGVMLLLVFFIQKEANFLQDISLLFISSSTPLWYQMCFPPKARCVFDAHVNIKYPLCRCYKTVNITVNIIGFCSSPTLKNTFHLSTHIWVEDISDYIQHNKIKIFKKYLFSRVKVYVPEYLRFYRNTLRKIRKLERIGPFQLLLLTEEKALLFWKYSAPLLCTTVKQSDRQTCANANHTELVIGNERPLKTKYLWNTKTSFQWRKTLKVWVQKRLFQYLREPHTHTHTHL